MNTVSESEKKVWLITTSGYYLILVVNIVAAIFPQHRWWGFNHWAYYSSWVPFVLAGAAVLVPPIVWYLRDKIGNFAYAAVTGFVTVAMGLLFYLLRARTHFDGDGYLVRSMLAEDNPLIKFTNFGAVVVNRFLYGLLSDIGSDPAKLTFQLVSYVAGMVFLVSVAVVAESLFEKPRKRTLFLLGCTSAGYMLLFFGHVENYSLFAASVGVFCAFGVMIAAGKLNRWMILIPLAAALFFNILGVTFIPAAVFILCRHTKLAEKFGKINRRLLVGLAVVAAAVLLSIFVYIYRTEYFFRFAIVPLVTDRFTLKGYTLFSMAHLADLLNLLVLMLPGLPLVLLAWRKIPARRLLRMPTNRFLLLAFLFAFGAVIIFDPKLGMPRDWDLFAFFAIPAAFLAFSLLLNESSKFKTAGTVAVLMIFLGWLTLFSRAYNQTNDDISIARMQNYIRLDPLKNRTGLWVLIGYYNDQGDSLSAEKEFATWPELFPEWEINRRGSDLINSGQFRQAIGYLRQAISINPGYYMAYSNLGSAYFYMQQHDSAIVYYEIANGMNPGNSTLLSNLSGAYYNLRQYSLAEERATEARRLDSNNVAAILNLALVYQATNRHVQYVELMERACRMPDVPLGPIQQLIGVYLREGRFDDISALLPRAVSLGLDTTQVKLLRQKYPQLR